MILKMILVLIYCWQTVVCFNETPQEAESSDQTGDWKNIALGFGLVVFGATLSTLGAMVLYLDAIIKRFFNVKQDFSLSTSKGFLSSSLSFSAGVLAVTVFINLLPEGIRAFENSKLFGHFSGLAAGLYFSACMMGVIVLKTISHKRNKTSDNETKISEEMASKNNNANPKEPVVFVSNSEEQVDERHMKRLGFEIALAIALHNFPEGVVTFVASYKSIKGGLLFGIALALHKFPEGIMIGVPIFAGTGSKWKAVVITAAASYITQLIGALFAYLLFKVYWNDIIAGVLFLLAAAILSNTLFGGMIPLARSYDKDDQYCSTWMAIGITIFVFMTSAI